MKKLLCLIVMLACAFVFFGCTQNESDAITFGILGPFSGNLSVYGTSVREGAMLAIDDLNANGGILGKQVKALSDIFVPHSGQRIKLIFSTSLSLWSLYIKIYYFRSLPKRLSAK